ncbi:MAG: Gfo/Idh/MocA family oxidoreductase [Labilithrix sp.]|nr:Gfo/Idh/MocA family oxidoreductase [Labilithrix sp.]MCW5833608.1 Gfo/Idh/MocA family oxidoreductase [Labilithrix sp.]
MRAKRVEGRKVRYAAVAGGWISQEHFMPAVKNTDNSELTALVTGDPHKAEALKDEFGLERTYDYDDFDELLSEADVDAVYIATPNWLHTRYAVPALEAGVHVLLEKPMAVGEADCKKIMAAAEKSGAKLMIAYRLQFEPATLSVLERVRSGEIGEARLFTSTFTQPVRPENHRAKHGFDAGPAYDMGPYPINACRHLFEAEPLEVSATATRNVGWGLRDLDDTISVTLRFPEDRLASFVVSYTLGMQDEYRITGTEGTIAVEPAYMFDVALGYDLVRGQARRRVAFPETDQFGGETQYFSNCILHDLAPEPDGEEGWCDVRVIEAIRRALETGRAQALEPYTRRRRVEPSQVVELDPVRRAPERLVDAAAPTSA